MSDITIYHNPDCGTSRNTLALIRAFGIEPRVIEYLKTPPSREELRSLLGRMSMTVRSVLRTKGTPFNTLGLDAPHWSDEQLLDHVSAHPSLLNRPIVVSPLGVRLCRPSDMAVELLPQRVHGDVFKEDGSPVLADVRIAGEDAGLAGALREAGLPTEDLEEAERQFFEYRTLGGDLVGYGGFERFGEDVLLRSIVVEPRARDLGIGRGIVALLMRRAFDQGGRRAWALTTSATGFFERAGFKVADRAAAPSSILATREALQLCPASATLLSRAITL